MNLYQKLSKLKDELFRRKTGIKRKTFERMVVILKEAELEKKKQGGKPNQLSVEERLLMCLDRRYLGEEQRILSPQENRPLYK